MAVSGMTPALVLAAALVTLPAHAQTEVFANPAIKGMRLDWCMYWAHDCGEPAADFFCREQGFARSLRFSIDQNVGRRGVVTLVLGDGRLCAAPTCSGFRSITCARP